MTTKRKKRNTYPCDDCREQFPAGELCHFIPFVLEPALVYHPPQSLCLKDWERANKVQLYELRSFEASVKPRHYIYWITDEGGKVKAAL